jgi:hypothetical protein
MKGRTMDTIPPSVAANFVQNVATLAGQTTTPYLAR